MKTYAERTITSKGEKQWHIDQNNTATTINSQKIRIYYLLDKLYKLRMSGMAEELENQLLNPNAGLESFETRFSDIVNFEWSQRENKKFNRLLKQATLKYPSADLDQSLYEPERQLNTRVIELLFGKLDGAFNVTLNATILC